MCVLLDADGCVCKRPLVRSSVHNRKVPGVSATANSYTAASNAYSDPVSCDAYSDTSSPNPYSRSDADTKSKPAETKSYTQAGSNARTNGKSYRYTDPNRHRLAQADSDSYGHTDGHANSYT